MDDETERKIWMHTLRNAILHDGKAQLDSVISGLMSEEQDINPKQIIPQVKEIIEEVNDLPVTVQEKEAEKLGVKLKREKEEDNDLPVVEGEEEGAVITRAAPNPNGPFHLGNSRAYILSYLYAKRNDGRFILRFDDTDPSTPEKLPEERFYDWIEEDLNWLDCKPDLVFRASERLDIYHNIAKKLIDDGNAYVCTCENEKWRELRDEMESCPCRNLDAEDNLDRWHGMLDGKYSEGEVVVRIKTDIEHKNPAIRDWPALRIIEEHKHPLVEEDYKVWPLYNFASAIDDHDFNVTHIFRAEEHSSNTEKQKWLYKHMDWEYPITIHHGFLSLRNAILSTSKIRQGIESGKYTGWDDPRLGTIRALKRRGFQPETIHDLIKKYGPKKTNATVSMESVKSINRKRVDSEANRYFFVSDPVHLTIDDPMRTGEIDLPLHPESDEKRQLNVNDEIIIDREDFEENKGEEIRLKDLYNIRTINDDKVECTSNEIVQDMPKIHWLPDIENQLIDAEVVMNDGNVISGKVEKNVTNEDVGNVLQFERFGFVRLDEKNEYLVRFYYAHK